MKRILLLLCLTSATMSLHGQGQPRPHVKLRRQQPFSVVEATIPEMQAAMKQGRVTSRGLVVQYLVRIARFNRRLNGVITVNPRALQEADARDRERAQGKVRGPLHGIPIALKDNIQTTEIPMPGGYNSLVGFSMNPYDPRRDPRDSTFDGRPALGTGGSSSGVGTAANFWAANVGTETSGSILSPANQNMLAAIKPTVGRISRHGIIPITADQDTAGPLAKTVTDAAIVFGALESPAPDRNDPATQKCAPPLGRDYTRFLKPDGLKGARIGIPRAFYYDALIPPGEKEARGGLHADQKSVMVEAISILKQRGAVIVDPADIPSVISKDPQNNLLKWNTCSGLENRKGMDESCSIVLKYGMKRDFNKWLASLDPATPVKTLSELRKYNLAHTAAGTLKFGQSQLDNADEIDLDADRARYQADRAKDLDLAGAKGIDATLKENNLDALLFPGATGAAIAAKPGYPTVIVPFGLVANAPDVPFPDGFNAKPAPFAVSFTSTACSEPRLLEFAYAFEHATKRRVPPAF